MKEYITPNVRANTIQMKRTLFAGTFLVVEGLDDKKTFDRFIDHETCQVIVAEGKENAIVVTRILNGLGFVGLLAIVDADCDRILNTVPPESNILLTDFHDIECMMLLSPALDHVLAELGKEDRIIAYEMRSSGLLCAALAKRVTALGCLRLVSLKDSYSLTFEEITFTRFVSATDLECDRAAMVRTVVNKSGAHALNQNDLKERIEVEMSRGHALWQIVCGHDVIEMLAIAFRGPLANRDAHEVAPVVLQRCLRLAYQFEDFLETELARLIGCWEGAHPPYRVLAAR